MRPPASPRERLDWLRLIRAEHVGPVTFTTLLQRYGSAARALEVLPDLASRGGARGAPRVPSLAEADDEVAALTRLGGRFLALGEADYPALLAAADGAPPLLAVLGHPSLLTAKTIALVGARNASGAGIRMARELATELGRAGFVIVSGLARGIDTAAHEAGFATGTVGVLAGGVDVVYPPENQKLYDKMRGEGAIISEMPLGTAPQARHFPRRNRLISGLCRAVIVVEAAERSGSLITARLANEQGREVFVVPGSPADPRCRGSNRLIREGATLVQSAGDVIESLTTLPLRRLEESDADRFEADAPPAGDAEIERFRPLVLERLGPTPIEIDELVRQTGAPVQAVASILLALDLAGRLSRQPGQKVALL
jgi:DNA processing protein